MGAAAAAAAETNNLLDELHRKEQFIQGRLAKVRARLAEIEAGAAAAANETSKLEAKAVSLQDKLDAAADAIDDLL